MKRFKVVWLSIFLFLIFNVFVWAQGTKILTPEDVVRIKYALNPVISPDGENIAYVMRVPRDTTDKPGPAFNEIWVVDAAGQNARRFTREKESSRTPQWSVDGEFIYFLSRRKPEKFTQVYRIRFAGGEAEKVTRAPNSIYQYRLSPDGKWLAFAYKDARSKDEQKTRKKGNDWTVFEKDYKYTRLWLMNLENRDSLLLTPQSLNIWNFVWSPDGQKLLLTATEKPFTDDSYMFKKIYILEVASKKLELLHDPAAKIGAMEVSPDGKRFAFLAGVDINDPTSGSLFVLNFETGKVENISGDFPGTLISLRWLNNNEVLTVAQQEVFTNLLRWNIQKKSFRPVIKNGPIFSAISLDQKRKKFAFSASTPQHPYEIYIGKLNGKFERLTDSNPWLSDYRLAEQMPVEWTARDGLRIVGVLLKPLDFQEGVKYPLILQIHGGPESAYMNGWNTSYGRWSQLLAARGYMVLMPNYRGSTGRGVAYSRMDHRDLGGKEFTDVLDGIRFLAEKGWVDSTRVGIGGGSYGGYFSALAATRYSKHFKASVVFAGISNWISFTGTSDIPRENSLVHWNLFWVESKENEQLYWERSPMAHIRNARTPTLIAHGTKDLRVPVSQSHELYRGLEMRKVPVELVLYPREPHGLLERAHQLDYMKRALEWYDRYVKGVK